MNLNKATIYTDDHEIVIKRVKPITHINGWEVTVHKIVNSVKHELVTQFISTCYESLFEQITTEYLK